MCDLKIKFRDYKASVQTTTETVNNDVNLKFRLLIMKYHFKKNQIRDIKEGDSPIK